MRDQRSKGEDDPPGDRVIAGVDMLVSKSLPEPYGSAVQSGLGDGLLGLVLQSIVKECQRYTPNEQGT